VVDVEPAFVSDGKSAKSVEPGEAAFDHPTVAAEPLACLDTAACDPWLDLTTAAGVTATAMVICLVGVQLVWSASRPAQPAADGRDGIEQLLERNAVVDIGSGQQEGQRNAAAIRDQVPLGPWFTSICWVRAGRRSPLFAAMDELSTQARLQSIRSASRNRHSSSRCKRSHTPAACQSRSRRQQVTPEPHPISAGSISHGMPVRRTNRMPVRTARAGTGGRPPFGFGAARGNSGSMIDHSESETRGAGIQPT